MQELLLRIIALGAIIFVSVVHVNYLSFIAQSEWQIVIGTLVVGVILFGDAIAGMLFGIVFLLTYLRYYMNKYNIASPWEMIHTTNKYPMSSLVADYITPQNLKDAQNNIVNERSYKKEYTGVHGVYGEKVYAASAQGDDDLLPGLVN